MKITVVVCTYNGGRKIEPTLKSLINQTHTPEIVVVNDGSVDNVREVVENYPVRLINFETNQGLSSARNAGIAAASWEIVAFCDDDCVPPSNWVENLEKIWLNMGEEVCGVGGGVVALERGTIAQRYAETARVISAIDHETSNTFFAKILRYLKGPKTMGPRWVASLVGANMSFRKNKIEEVGGFNPDIKFGGDETYLCEVLRKKFGENTLWFEPEILMLHAFEPKLRDTLRRSRAYGRGGGRDWVNQGGLPVLKPGLFLLGILVILGYIGGRIFFEKGVKTAVLTTLIAPYVLRRHMWRGQGREGVILPGVDLLVEGAGLFGFIEGVFKTKRGFLGNKKETAR